ncbi:DUF3909 family protein [Microbacteriaceae bacterium 4G12]
MSLMRFDEIIDQVQSAKTRMINDKQKAAFQKKYRFEPSFEYGRDGEGRYVIRTTKEMIEEMEFYLALKYERDVMDVFIDVAINGTSYISVSYGQDAIHLQELFQFLEDHE